MTNVFKRAYRKIKYNLNHKDSEPLANTNGEKMAANLFAPLVAVGSAVAGVATIAYSAIGLTRYIFGGEEELLKDSLKAGAAGLVLVANAAFSVVYPVFSIPYYGYKSFTKEGREKDAEVHALNSGKYSDIINGLSNEKVAEVVNEPDTTSLTLTHKEQLGMLSDGKQRREDLKNGRSPHVDEGGNFVDSQGVAGLSGATAQPYLSAGRKV